MKWGVIACAVVGYWQWLKIQKSCDEMEDKLNRMTKLRQEERRGRVQLEKAFRNKMVEQSNADGYKFQPIGFVRSCFPDRRGTPRQGLLVAGARARIEMSKHIDKPALEGLEKFSHIWVIFVFHENTNVQKQGKCKAKVKPPRLHGEKVGLFSTRTPHRPNAIGLSVLRLHQVQGRILEISGHDLVDGTPILDVKPYLPNDAVPTCTCPDWVPHQATDTTIQYSDIALEKLNSLIKEGHFSFYTTIQDVQSAIEDMLLLDIRSAHRRSDSEEYQVDFDKIRIQFKTTESCIAILNIRNRD